MPKWLGNKNSSYDKGNDARHSVTSIVSKSLDRNPLTTHKTNLVTVPSASLRFYILPHTLMHRCGKGQDSYVARPLNGDRHLSLMFCAVSRDSPGNNFPPFRDEISKDLWILVIDIQFFVRTEPADLSPHERFSLPVGACFFWGSPHSILLVSLTRSPVASPAFVGWTCRCSGSTLCNHRPSGR